MDRPLLLTYSDLSAGKNQERHGTPSMICHCDEYGAGCIRRVSRLASTQISTHQPGMQRKCRGSVLVGMLQQHQCSELPTVTCKDKPPSTCPTHCTNSQKRLPLPVKHKLVSQCNSCSLSGHCKPSGPIAATPKGLSTTYTPGSLPPEAQLTTPGWCGLPSIAKHQSAAIRAHDCLPRTESPATKLVTWGLHSQAYVQAS
jgi:hypothetical protein